MDADDRERLTEILRSALHLAACSLDELNEWSRSVSPVDVKKLKSEDAYAFRLGVVEAKLQRALELLETRQ